MCPQSPTLGDVYSLTRVLWSPDNRGRDVKSHRARIFRSKGDNYSSSFKKIKSHVFFFRGAGLLQLGSLIIFFLQRNEKKQQLSYLITFAKTGFLCSKFENSFPSSKPRNALSALETGLVSRPSPFPRVVPTGDCPGAVTALPSPLLSDHVDDRRPGMVL